MNKKVAIIISPNWRDYAKTYLADCLESLRQQDWTGESKLFLVDNESSEESYAYLKAEAPEAEILRNQDNAGFARGNNVAMAEALRKGFDYLLLLNMDTVAAPSAVRELVAAAELDPKIGAVQARLMLWQEQDKVNSLGNDTHFLGFGYCRGYQDSYQAPRLSAVVDIFYPSGAAVMFPAEALKRVGLFDEEFWMYNEDQDLGWRLWLSGYRCVLAPEAAVYHKYEFSRSIKKYYWMDRNRLLAIFKNYRSGTLLLVLPAFLAMEFGLLYFAAKGGWLRDKFRVYGYFLAPRTWRYLRQARRQAQRLRQVGDRKIIRMLSSRVEYQEIASPALKLANRVFTAYWALVRPLIIW